MGPLPEARIKQFLVILGPWMARMATCRNFEEDQPLLRVKEVSLEELLETGSDEWRGVWCVGGRE